MDKETILTGIRSNDEPTLGNYIGAFWPIVDMAIKNSGDYQINMFVPDLHSFTTPIDYDNLYSQTIRNIKLFVASGLPIDDPNVYIYRQSFIPAHSELAWILSCFVGFGEASRMVEFKDKTTNIGENSASVGLFNYPILMASDILLYGAKWVPVGEDQRQHLELARDIAIRFNNKFGDVFTVPHDINKQTEFINRDSAPRIRSLRNPDKKMSKSISDPSGTILLSDSSEKARKKIMSATTDSVGTINFDWQNQPGITNLLQMLSFLSHRKQTEINSEWVGKQNYGELKKAVAQITELTLAKLNHNFSNIDDANLQSKLVSSEKQMNKVASQTLFKVQQKIGLRAK